MATAKRGGVRIIAIVMGSKDRKVRDAKAEELLAKGFALVPPKPEVAVSDHSKPEPAPEKIASVPAAAPVSEPEKIASVAKEPAEAATSSGRGWGMFFLGVVVGIGLSAILAYYLNRPPRRRSKFVKYS